MSSKSLNRFRFFWAWQLLLFIAFFSFPNRALPQTQNKVGEVIAITGSMKVLRADGITQEQARVGLPIYPGDRLETDSASVSKVQFMDKSFMTVGKQTTAKISDYAFNFAAKQRKALLQLVMGQLHMVVEHYSDWSNSQYELRTGSAVAGIRGTEIVVRVLTNGLSEFYVLEGLMDVKGTEGAKQIVSISGRQYSLVPLGGQPSVPLVFEPGKLKTIMENMGEKLPDYVVKAASRPSALRTLSEQEARKVVTQGEWAKMLADNLGLAAAGVQEGMDQAAYMDMLSGGKGKTLEAESPNNQSKYLAQVDVSKEQASGGGFLEAKSLSGSLRMSTFVPRPGKYPVKVRSKGTLLISIANQTVVVEPGKSDKLDWHELGQFQLQGGENVVSVVVSRGSQIDAFQIDSRCADPIAPAGGWNGDAPLTYAEKAETLVKAMGQQGNLPVDGSFMQIFRAENVGVVKGDYKKISVNNKQDTSVLTSRNAIQAGVRSANVSWTLNLPGDGVYSFATQAAGTAPFVWSIDGCDIARHVPQYPDLTLVWEDISTRNLTKGNHILEVTVPAGATLDSVRLIRRKSGAADYLNLLASLGFKEGKLGDPVVKASAQDNLNNDFFKSFLSDKSDQDDQVPDPPVDVAELPPDFIDDGDFPYGSPASPVIPGMF